MSNPMSQPGNDLNTAAMRPEHQIHGSSDVLPGSKGVSNIDYSAENIERSGPNKVWSEGDEREFARDQTSATHPSGTHHDTSGQNAFNSERPMNVQPTEAGGVAIGGRSDLPEGKASATDKLIGKTQKVMGKMTHNAEMHEKGELRESGGKAVAAGGARAPHD
ncbi:hypothetical protein V5O48_006874 [Marasmius crinis-equi]|uniref:Uncharacterized protein n=1 Tax=Marasmius crinis-equi TaxID=585013 RepID=A0ABR3FIP3_9AGAR